MTDIHLAVAGRIRRELQELDRVVRRTQQIWQEGRAEQNYYYVDAVALNLHSFYAGLERVFELIADGVDRAKPAGASWHQELLHQMAAEIPGVRPAVLTPQIRNRLDRFRGFRHVVRNVYTFSLDSEQIALLMEQLQPTFDQVSEELAAFADFLEQLAS